MVGLFVIVWIIFGYIKRRRRSQPESPMTRDITDTMVSTGIDVPFNIDVDDLIERYRALGGEI